MISKSYIKYPVLILFVLSVVAGCKKLDLAPRDRYSDLTYWNTSANVNLALTNIYHWLYTSNYVLMDDGLSDNAYRRGDDVTLIASGNFTPDLGRFRGEWGYYFSGLKACNLFLGNVDNNQTLDEAIKGRMKAEVRFIRAWFHFQLTKWWGDVPIVDKELSVEEAKSIHRSPKAEVVKFILDELDAAIASLPKKEGYADADLGRITKGAALALKARVLLYEGNRMTEVATVCEQLMNQQATNGAYSLESNYSDLFSNATVNKKTNESILSLQFAPVDRTWGEYFDMAPISEGARTNGLAPTQELVNSYIMLNGKAISEAGSGYDENNPYINRDPRLTATIVYNGYRWQRSNGTTTTIYIKPGSTPAGEPTSNEYKNDGQSSQTGYYWRKYWDPKYTSPGISSGLNLHLIRYAEVLLMYAEAKEALGQFTEAVWDQTIKPLRQRAGFTDAGALNFPGPTNIKNIIRNERRVEFALEGLRIDDIRRWKIAETVLNGWAHGAKYGDPTIDNGYIRVQLRTFNASKHYLWPVPPSEIELNKNLLPQNPNY